MFWRLELATVWRLNPVAKFTCLAEIGAVLKLVSVFPRTFVTVHLLSKLPPFQTLCESIFKPHWCIISYPNHQEKVWFFWFLNLIFAFTGFSCWCLGWYCVRYTSLIWNGFSGSCLILFSSDFMLNGQNVIFIVLIYVYYWVWKSFDKWVWCLFDLLISLA